MESERAGPIPLRPGGIHFEFELIGGAYSSGDLSHRTGTLPLDLIQRRVRVVFDGEGGAHLCAEKKMTATAVRVEEAELDGEGQKRLRRCSSSNSRRQLAPRRPNAAPSASSTSPAELATSNKSERGEVRVSGR
jgi:hypothetical protein